MSLVSSVRDASPLVRRLALTNFLMQVANQAGYFVGLIGTATYAFGADAYGVAVLVATINGAYLVGSGLIGVVIDRRGPRAVLVRLLTAFALAAALACAVPLSYPMLVGCGGLLAGIIGAASTTVMSFPPYLVDDPEELKNANSLVDSAVHLAIIVGPAAGGATAAVASSSSVFALSALAMGLAVMVAAGLEERLTPPREPAPATERGAFRELLAGLRLTFASPSLRFLFAAGFFGFFAYGAFDALESLFYRDVLRVDVPWMGYLSMVSGMGAVVGSIILLRIPHERVSLRLLVGMLLLTGIGTTLYVGTDQLAIAALGQAITGMGFGLMMPVQHLLVQESCELAYLGRVNSVMRVGLNSSGVLPLLVAPALSKVVGVQGVLVGASLLVVAVALALGLVLRLRAEPPRQIS